MKTPDTAGVQSGADLRPLVRSDFNISPGAALVLLVLLLIICFIGTAGASYIVGRVLEGKQVAALRISAMIQDIVLFILPALATAVIATRRSAALLCVRRLPSMKLILLATAVMVAAIPAIEAVIYWNDNIDFSFLGADVEALLRSVENTSAQTLAQLMGDGNIGSLIMNLLIVGIAAGFSEELLFRGTIQRLFQCTGMGPHLAIWVTAIIFSAVHMQFYGFVPRMLLGAFFGYLLYWSRSLWLPVFAHALNNSIYVVTAWLHVRAGESVLDSEPALWSPAATIVSALAATVLLWAMARRRSRDSAPDGRQKAS